MRKYFSRLFSYLIILDLYLWLFNSCYSLWRTLHIVNLLCTLLSLLPHWSLVPIVPFIHILFFYDFFLFLFGRRRSNILVLPWLSLVEKDVRNVDSFAIIWVFEGYSMEVIFELSSAFDIVTLTTRPFQYLLIRTCHVIYYSTSAMQS